MSYCAIENTANQNTGKPLHLTIPSLSILTSHLLVFCLLYLLLQCSQRCGVGFQLRVVKCAYPNWKITKDENCDPRSRPDNRRNCQIKPCKTTTIESNGDQLPSTTRARPTTTPAPTTPREIPSWKEGKWSEVKTF